MYVLCALGVLDELIMFVCIHLLVFVMLDSFIVCVPRSFVVVVLPLKCCFDLLFGVVVQRILDSLICQCVHMFSRMFSV